MIDRIKGFPDTLLQVSGNLLIKQIMVDLSNKAT
jgi:hypothetical protein